MRALKQFPEGTNAFIWDLQKFEDTVTAWIWTQLGKKKILNPDPHPHSTERLGLDKHNMKRCMEEKKTGE